MGKMKIRKWRKYKKKRLLVLLWCIVILGIGWSYLVTTNYIEKNLYPKGGWFELSMDKNISSECMTINTQYITYYNDISKNAQLGNGYFNPNTPNMLYMQIRVSRVESCKFEHTEIKITATNVTDPIKLEDSSNLSSIKKIEDDSFIIDLNYSENTSSQEIELWIPINQDFFSIYGFRWIGSAFMSLNFNFKDGMDSMQELLKFNAGMFGYYADETTFTLPDRARLQKEEKLPEEEMVINGNSKHYTFKNTDQALIQFTPKSKGLFLLQKILDALLLGFVASAFYVAIEKIISRLGKASKT